MMIGKRIKNIRKKCGMTQKELGVAVGFNVKSADVRIAQYESGKRKPKEKILTSIANALNVSLKTLDNPDRTIIIETKIPIEAKKEYNAVDCRVDFTVNECITCESKGLVIIKDTTFHCPECFNGGKPEEREFIPNAKVTILSYGFIMLQLSINDYLKS